MEINILQGNIHALEAIPIADAPVYVVIVGRVSGGDRGSFRRIAVARLKYRHRYSISQ